MRAAIHQIALFASVSVCLLAGCKRHDFSSPKAAAETYLKALEEGDAQTAKDACTGGDPRMIDALVRVSAHFKQLRSTAVSHFGEAGKAIAGAPGALNAADHLAGADVKQEGDMAIVLPKDGTLPMRLLRTGGEWKVDMSSTSPGMTPDSFDALIRAADDLTDEIETGKYPTAGHAQAAFASKLMAAMPAVTGRPPTTRPVTSQPATAPKSF